MTIVLAILLGALLLKDVAPLGDRYLLRGIAESLALLAGSAWLVVKGGGLPWRRYWLLIGYLGILALTIEFSKGGYGAAQVASLAAVLIFFIAYVEFTGGEAPLHNQIIFSLTLALVVICIAAWL